MAYNANNTCILNYNLLGYEILSLSTQNGQTFPSNCESCILYVGKLKVLQTFQKKT
jgi:hypothetical protein